jgi:uncharacterized protein YkwD
VLNDERVKVGVSELALDSSLTAAAYGHSEDMAVNNYFSHNSKDGRRFSDRIIAQGYRYSIAGENIAYHYGAPDAAKVFEMWMNSPGHKSNMLSSSFSDAGLGFTILGSIHITRLTLEERVGLHLRRQFESSGCESSNKSSDWVNAAENAFCR